MPLRGRDGEEARPPPRSLSPVFGGPEARWALISFLLLRNGQPLGRGAVREGVLSAIVGWVSGRAGRPSELRCSLSGLETSTPQEEHLGWVDIDNLAAGDVVTIRIEEGPAADAPRTREPGYERGQEADGSRSVRCSFCDQFRGGHGGMGGADVVMCSRCVALAAELLDRDVAEVFHLRAVEGGDCSFCLRSQRSKTVGAHGHSICSECLRTAS